MNNEVIVKQIHSSDIFGTFIETGAGNPVSTELFNYNGASKTIYKTESPYHFIHQKNKYPATVGLRSVSKEFTLQIIRREMEMGHFEIEHNTYYVSSFQIENKPEMLTHGWIGLRYRGVERYYHITFTPPGKSRANIISLIGSIALRILSCKNDLKELVKVLNDYIMNNYIDIIEDAEGNSYLEEVLSIVEKAEHPITISKEGKLIRLEDLSRKGDLILMKGSFNPIHNHHVELIKQTEKQCPSTIPCFSISLETYSKGPLEFSHLVDRIKMINKLGYPVIIFNSGFFSENVKVLRSRYFKNKIILPTGCDTVNRLIESSYNNFSKFEDVDNFNNDFRNVEFPYIERSGTTTTELIKVVGVKFKKLEVKESNKSSTSIRTLFEERKEEEIKELVPTELYNDIITYLNKTIKK